MLPKLREKKHTKEYFHRLETFFDNRVNLKSDFDIFLKKYNRNLQREYCWVTLQQQELIHSILIDRNIPPICVVEYSRNYIRTDIRNSNIPEAEFFKVKYKIIDGKQRLLTHKKFIDNEFFVEIDGNNYFFKDLPKDYQYRILSYEYRCIFKTYDNIEDCTDDDLLELFKLCNFAGTFQDKEYLKNFK